MKEKIGSASSSHPTTSDISAKENKKYYVVEKWWVWLMLVGTTAGAFNGIMLLLVTL